MFNQEPGTESDIFRDCARVEFLETDLLHRNLWSREAPSLTQRAFFLLNTIIPRTDVYGLDLEKLV